MWLASLTQAVRQFNLTYYMPRRVVSVACSRFSTLHANDKYPSTYPECPSFLSAHSGPASSDLPLHSLPASRPLGRSRLQPATVEAKEAPPIRQFQTCRRGALGKT